MSIVNTANGSSASKQKDEQDLIDYVSSLYKVMVDLDAISNVRIEFDDATLQASDAARLVFQSMQKCYEMFADDAGNLLSHKAEKIKFDLIAAAAALKIHMHGIDFEDPKQMEEVWEGLGKKLPWFEKFADDFSKDANELENDLRPLSAKVSNIISVNDLPDRSELKQARKYLSAVAENLLDAKAKFPKLFPSSVANTLENIQGILDTGFPSLSAQKSHRAL